MTKPSMPPRVEKIMREVCAYHHVGINDLLTESQRRAIAHIRFEAYYRVRNEVTIVGREPSLEQIAGWFRKKDHTTIHHGIRRFVEMNPSKIPPSCRGEPRFAYRAPKAPAAHRLQMMADLAEARHDEGENHGKPLEVKRKPLEYTSR